MLIAAAKLKKILITIKSTTLTILLLARVECKNMICRHCTLKLLFIIFCLLLTFSGISVIYNYLQLLGTMRKPTTYIVETKGCHIPDLDPWDPIILQHLKTPEKPICKNGKPTLVEKKSNRLYIVPKAVYAYKRKSRDDLQCCHRTFWRHPADYSGDEFKKIYSSECIPFNDTVITDDYKMVECTIGDKEVYRDYFAFVHVKPEIEARCEAAAKEHNAPNISILIMGIDGMSRNHFYRSMPRTLKLLRNMSAVDMAGMNTVGRHTILNLVPALAGLTLDQIKVGCWKDHKRPFDLCPWIFNDFKNEGFRTAYGETLANYSMFINGRPGFRVQPTDYYMQPAIVVGQDAQKVRLNKYCFGTRIESEILVNFADDFVSAMKSKRSFGFFWDGRLTYHDFNVHSTYDIMLENFLNKHLHSGVLNRTVLILLSDHGFRWGTLRKIYQGLHEQRNPFLFFVFPKWFKQKYSTATMNIYNNTKHLITHFDLYETLKDLLQPDIKMKDDVCLNQSQILKARTVLPRGISLFQIIPESRNCLAAEIENSLCLCQHFTPLDVNNRTVQSIAASLLQDLVGLVSSSPRCSIFRLEEITSAWSQTQNKSILQSMDNTFGTDVKGEISELVDYTVIIKTLPGHALFEGTYRYRPGTSSVVSSFHLVGDIQRVNQYGNESHCIDDISLKQYCYCIDLIK